MADRGTGWYLEGAQVNKPEHKAEKYCNTRAEKAENHRSKDERFKSTLLYNGTGKTYRRSSVGRGR